MMEKANKGMLGIMYKFTIFGLIVHASDGATVNLSIMADLFTGNHPCCELVAFQLKYLLFFITFYNKVKEGKKVYKSCLKTYKFCLKTY